MTRVSPDTLRPEERAFVLRRARMAGRWPVAGGLLLALALGYAAWLWVTHPLMIDPWAVMEAIESGGIPDGTLALMALMLPVVMLAMVAVIVACLALSFVAFANERRLIAIIRRLRPDDGKDR